jgi:hypothetical protein
VISANGNSFDGTLPSDLFLAPSLQCVFVSWCALFECR